MLSRERSTRRIDAKEAAVIQSGPSSHLRHERRFTQRLSGSNLPLDESKPGLRCTPRIQAGVLREELVICVASEGHGMDGRNPKRRLGGDIVAPGSSTTKSGVREGLRLLHSPPEGLRSKKGSESRIASADVPLAVGSDGGNKRRRSAPAVYKESGADHVEKESKASQNSNRQTEENERRSERVKERLKSEKKKLLDESQAIHWEVQIGSGRHKKTSKRRLQQKGNRGKSRVQAKKQVNESWSLKREKGMSSVSSQEGHEERGEGLCWTRRLRERGKKRVLEFCAEVEVEAFAPDVRVVKHKVDKGDEALESIPEHISDELDKLFVKSWSRKHRRNFRTRARFQSLTKQETQAGTTQDPGGIGVDHLQSSPKEALREAKMADPTVNKSKEILEAEVPLVNGWHVVLNEHDSSSIELSTSKSSDGKSIARSVQDSLAFGGRSEDRVQADIPSVPPESSHFEAVHVESDEQIHLVLHLCIESNREQSADLNPITSTSASFPVERVHSLRMEPLSGVLKSACSVSPRAQAPSFACCELGVVTSTSAKARDSVVSKPLSKASENMLGSTEEPTSQEIVGLIVTDVEEDRACKEVDREMMVDGRKDSVCTKIDKQIVIEVGELNLSYQVNKETVQEVREDMRSSEVVKEVVKVKEHAVCSKVIIEGVVENPENKVQNVVERQNFLKVQESLTFREVGKQKVVEVRDFGHESNRKGELEGQERLVHDDIAREKIPDFQGHSHSLCTEVKPHEVNEREVCKKIAEEQVFELRQRTGCCESSVQVLEGKKDTVCQEMMELQMSDVREHTVCTDAVQDADKKALKSLEFSSNLLLESGDESASGNSEEDNSEKSGKEAQRVPEDSAGNSVDDNDVLAKYRRTKVKRGGYRTILETTSSVKFVLEGGTSEDENLDRTEISGDDPGPSSLKASTSTGRSEPAEDNGSEDQEETAGTRLQSLLDVVRNEVNATPELVESWDCRETNVLQVVSHTSERKDELHPQEVFVKERPAKCASDTRRGIVSLGLKCGLCGGTSDGKWACELRSARKTKARDGSQHASPKVTKYSVKEGSKFQVKKGWLGRLLGPLSERVGVAGAWVHEECAVWSPEVYFAGVGRLKNVKAAIRRGRLLKCSHCGQPGATIGCRVDRCPQNYHLPCAHFDGCSFDHKKYLVACSEHLHLFPSRYRRFLEYGVEVQMGGSVDIKDTSKLHRGNFRRMMIERRAAASTARLKDLEEEEKCMEKSGEDEEFVRRERKRLQRDLARIVPTKLGGQKTDGEKNTIPEGWNSVAGLQDVVECLKEMVILPLTYPGAFDRLGVVPPRGVLLHGHSGTGKTLVVRALAGACARGTQKISYFARKGADCLGKYVGDAERQLRLLFQVAEQHQPSIIFFDEIDGLAPSRSRSNFIRICSIINTFQSALPSAEHFGRVEDGQDQTHSSVVSTLLALMDGLSSRGSVIVIGATNRPDALDPALRRPGRFDREIYFPLPSASDRAAILALHTRSWIPCPSGEVLSAVAKATHGFAGADLRALCVEVALKALKRVAPIHQLMKSAEGRQVGVGLPQLPKIEVKASDWASALKEAPPPCSMRMTSAALGFIPGSPLPWYLVPSHLPALVEILMQLHRDGRSSMPPALHKAVSRIAEELESFALDSKVCELRSNFKWMALLQRGGQKLMTTVEAALASAGLVGKREGLGDCRHDEPLCDEASPGNPFLFDVDSCPPKHDNYGGWRGGHFRVLISGKEKRGQRQVAASIITAFEGFCETRMLNLPTMLHEGDGDVIQGLNRILGAGTGTTPCMLFMPQIESWSLAKEEVGEDLLEETARSYVLSKVSVPTTVSSSWSVFLQHIKCLSPDTSFMFLATSHLPLDELPAKVVDFFLSDTNKCKDKHAISRNQPVPCAVVQLPNLKEHEAVVERASEDISRSLAGRVVRYLSHSEEASIGAHTSAFSRLEPSGMLSEDMPKEGSRDETVDEGGECVVADVECSKLMRQLPPSKVFDMPEHSGPKASSVEIAQKPESRNAVDDCQVPVTHPRNAPRSWSSEQKTLQIAISQLSHQVLNQSHFSELRRISGRMKAAPCLSTSLIDQRILATANQYRSSFLQADNKDFEDRLDRRDDKNTSASHIYGLVAIGWKGKSGLYNSGTEVACDIANVLKLLRERVKAKVESGRDYSVYVPLLSKMSGLEDLVSSWLYQIRRLEAAAKVLPLSGLQSGVTPLCGTDDVSHPGVFEAHEASVVYLPRCCDQTLSSNKLPEKVGETSPKGDQYALSVNPKVMGTHSYPLSTEDATTTHLLKVHDRASGLDSLEGCETSPSFSDKLTAKRIIEKKCSHPAILVDPWKSDFEVHHQPVTPVNHVKSQDRTKVGGPVAGTTEEKACQLPAVSSRTSRPKTRVLVTTGSLLALESAIRDMILSSWNGHTAKSVELLHEVIASCAASLRVVSDELFREVDWTSSCYGDCPCPLGGQQTSEVLDALNKEICLCQLTKAVRKLTTQSSEDSYDLSKT
ncbi:hypothetical protein AXG93_1130s1360 [Marchantia polymorpha subsp. ruderalis]|uniref:PHD-type domain-containing protein n=1 Tax=Marchantia polymorpha subsp. ruderalis TaxID=1480154 RepID=A0A176VHJ2_MARPO|nr:hypothetical protein AXG93_1130s1360 [Marchantia polymorpha subsp. ruderalis]